MVLRVPPQPGKDSCCLPQTFLYGQYIQDDDWRHGLAVSGQLAAEFSLQGILPSLVQGGLKQNNNTLFT